MFSIGFSDEPVEYPFDAPDVPAAPGMLVLGACREEFLANLSLWGKSDYEAHWRRELFALVEGRSKVALVVSYNDPKAASNLEIWRVYRVGDFAHFQNQIAWYESFAVNFDISEISSHIPDRTLLAENGESISEWAVPLRDLESFLRA